jgi:hypothetical protein
MKSIIQQLSMKVAHINTNKLNMLQMDTNVAGLLIWPTLPQPHKKSQFMQQDKSSKRLSHILFSQFSFD